MTEYGGLEAQSILPAAFSNQSCISFKFKAMAASTLFPLKVLLSLCPFSLLFFFSFPLAFLMLHPLHLRLETPTLSYEAEAMFYKLNVSQEFVQFRRSKVV